MRPIHRTRPCHSARSVNCATVSSSRSRTSEPRQACSPRRPKRPRRPTSPTPLKAPTLTRLAAGEAYVQPDRPQGARSEGLHGPETDQPARPSSCRRRPRRQAGAGFLESPRTVSCGPGRSDRRGRDVGLDVAQDRAHTTTGKVDSNRGSTSTMTTLGRHEAWKGLVASLFRLWAGLTRPAAPAVEPAPHRMVCWNALTGQGIGGPPASEWTVPTQADAGGSPKGGYEDE